MKSDRELLELAAKAVGITLLWAREPATGKLIDVSPRTSDELNLWNPLTDDGDALRLAVALRLDIKFLDGFKQVCSRRSDDRDNFEMHGLVGYGEGADPWVSTENVRRSIVRAAACIGEAMP